MMMRELWNILRGKSSNRQGWKKRPSSEGTTSSSFNDNGSRLNNKMNGSVLESRRPAGFQSIEGGKSIARSTATISA